MANYRTVYLSFWDDSAVTGDFTPEDKYFYLYLLTNAHVRLCGCCEISLNKIAFELGYSTEAVEKLVSRFENDYKKIMYDKETRELLVVNWLKYNNNSSPKFRVALEDEIDKVKSVRFREFLYRELNGENEDEIYPMDRVSIGYQEKSRCTVTVTDTDTVIDNNKSNSIKEKVYTDDFEEFWKVYPFRRGVKSKAFDKFKARLKEGYTADVLIKCAKNYAEYVKAKKISEEYVKHGATFLSSSHDFEGFMASSGIKDKNYVTDDEYDSKANEEAIKKMYGVG